MKYFYLLVSVFAFASCKFQDANVKSEKEFFDLQGLIDKQITDFQTKKPMLNKHMEINGNKEDVDTKDIDWAKELDIIRSADLNKSSYTNSYIKTEEKGVLIYTLKPDEFLPVKSQIISVLENGDVKIEINLATNNYLYDSEKKAEMLIENDRLKSYQISGRQKLFIGKVSNYNIKGEVHNPSH